MRVETNLYLAGVECCPDGLEKEKRAQHLGERGECARRRNGDLKIRRIEDAVRLQRTLKIFREKYS